METINVKLTQVSVNTANPRTISKEKMEKLINSILVFPKMLSIRPVVVDECMVALGGNMRIRALQAIANMKIADIITRLSEVKDYNVKNAGEQSNIIAYWTDWTENPTIEIVDASRLSEQERRQFVIKDNTSFGDWDFDALANEWSDIELTDWGLDVWETSEEKPGSGNSVAEEDDFDEEKDVVVCRCKRGDIWQLGEHRVMCGDSTSHQDVETLLGGGEG